MTDQPFPAAAINDALHWGQFLTDEWRQDFPTQIQSNSTLSSDGTPEWVTAFRRWLTNAPDEERHRTTAVMRRLRRVAPREYEVLYRTMILGEPLEETTLWLNDRALRNHIPYPEGRPTGPHYRLKDAVALFMAGVEFAKAYY